MRAMMAAMMVVALTACIQEAHRTRPWEDPLACGKCVLAYEEVFIPNADGFNERCVEYVDGSLCCPQSGDTGCPTDVRGYAWLACNHTVTRDGATFCADADSEDPTCSVPASCD